MEVSEVTIRLPDGIHGIAQLARAEGFRHIDRLIADFESGKNRFDKPGEVLLAVHEKEELVAIGGINTYSEEARIRRVYVVPLLRRTGVGRLLMAKLEEHAQRAGFTDLQLLTDTESGAKFYDSLGFKEVKNEEHVTHRKRLA